LLRIHKPAFMVLEVAQFLDCQANVSKCRGDTQNKENDGHPRLGIKFCIKVAAYAISDKDRKGHLQTQTTEICKILDIAPVTFFQNQFV